MAAAASSSNLRFSPLSNLSSSNRRHLPFISIPTPKRNTSFPILHSLTPNLPTPSIPTAGSGSGSGGNHGGGRGSGGGRGGGDHSNSDGNSSDSVGPLGFFLSGWRSRVAADPQFPFKVLMEELVGVSACVLGDMASRPNFGLNELDFVFSTLVVGSILNFTLMYLLAPTSSSSAAAVSALPSYIFEPGPFSLASRVATLISKGATFAAVGFAAGLAGTALSNGLIKLRKKIDPEFETPNKPPPTLLNSLTWATHMGVSSNLRYQTLNGLEYLMGKGLPPLVFKFSVVILRCLNNVLGGITFVSLARLTGAQKVEAKKGEEEEKLIAETVTSGGDDEQSSK